MYRHRRLRELSEQEPGRREIFRGPAKTIAAFLAAIFLIFGAIESFAADPIVTECPEKHPEAPTYVLDSAEILPTGGVRYGLIADLKERDKILHAVNPFRSDSDWGKLRDAQLECSYDDGRGRPHWKILLVPIPGILWRCDTIIRTWGKKDSTHLWAWCTSLPE